jgi:hypothetical protein
MAFQPRLHWLRGERDGRRDSENVTRSCLQGLGVDRCPNADAVSPYQSGHEGGSLTEPYRFKPHLDRIYIPWKDEVVKRHTSNSLTLDANEGAKEGTRKRNCSVPVDDD